MDSQTASPSPSYNQDSDVTLVESIGENAVNSDYVESAKNSPLSSGVLAGLMGEFLADST